MLVSVDAFADAIRATGASPLTYPCTPSGASSIKAMGVAKGKYLPCIKDLLHPKGRRRGQGGDRKAPLKLLLKTNAKGQFSCKKFRQFLPKGFAIALGEPSLPLRMKMSFSDRFAGGFPVVPQPQSSQATLARFG